MTTPCYLHTTPSGVELIEGDKMPVRLDHPCEAGIPGPGCPMCIGYEAAQQAAKASGIPVKDQERAKAMIKSHLKEKNPGLPAVMFEETIYGPFNISYKVRYRTDKGTPIRGKMYLTEGGQPPQDLKEGIPYAILHDDTPESKFTITRKQ